MPLTSYLYDNLPVSLLVLPAFPLHRPKAMRRSFIRDTLEK